MSEAPRDNPRGRHHPLNSHLFLARIARAGFVDTSYAVDPDFDAVNEEPLTAEGLDHCYHSRGAGFPSSDSL